MNKHKFDVSEIKEIAHFLTKRSITSAAGQPITALTEYLEIYNNLISKIEEYNKTID